MPETTVPPATTAAIGASASASGANRSAKRGSAITAQASSASASRTRRVVDPGRPLQPAVSASARRSPDGTAGSRSNRAWSHLPALGRGALRRAGRRIGDVVLAERRGRERARRAFLDGRGPIAARPGSAVSRCAGARTARAGAFRRAEAAARGPRAESSAQPPPRPVERAFDRGVPARLGRRRCGRASPSAPPT